MRVWWENLSVRKRGIALVGASFAGTAILCFLLFIIIPLSGISLEASSDSPKRLYSFLFHLLTVPIVFSFVMGGTILVSGKMWSDLRLWKRLLLLFIGTFISLILVYMAFSLTNKGVNSIVYSEQTRDAGDFSDPYLALEELMVRVDACSEDDLSCLTTVGPEVIRNENFMKDVLEIYPSLRSKDIILIEGLGKKRVLRYQDFEAMSKRYREKLERAKAKG